MTHPPVVTVIMAVFGVLLLLPGICAVVFMVGMGVSDADSSLAALWLICFLITAGGVWVLVAAFR
jgi:hypothetical protein